LAFWASLRLGVSLFSELVARHYNFKDRSRSAFPTTLMLLKAIAAAAKMGLSWRRKAGAQSNGASTPAAMGMRMTL